MKRKFWNWIRNETDGERTLVLNGEISDETWYGDVRVKVDALPDSYEVQLADVEADSGGETEAGTTQRDVVRLGVVSIAVSFSLREF